MDIGVAIPQVFVDGQVDVARIRAFVQRAEALGCHSLWVLEHTLGPPATLEPIELMTYAAALTRRVRLGSSVLLTALYDPVRLAKRLATLDHLSGGRLDVGVGLGSSGAQYPVHGLSAERRGARFEAGLELMKRLWTEPRVTAEGPFWQLENVALEPRPVQRPHPPIWFGGHSPKALRRAVELGDGFIGAGSRPVDQFLEETRQLRDLLAERGRDPATFPIGKRVYLAIDRDRERARRRLSAWFEVFYGSAERALETAIWGSAEECAERLAPIAAAGADLLVLHAVFDELEQLELIAAELAPRLSTAY